MRKDFNANLQIGSGKATQEEEESWKTEEKDLSNITHPFSGSERNRLFLSSHGDSFLDVSGISGVDSPADGRVSVWLDMDRDGRLDLAVVNSNRPLLQLYRNGTGELTAGSSDAAQATESGSADQRKNFIALRFVGGNNAADASDEYSNRDGFGARVTVDAEGRQIIREHLCGQGFSGQNSSTMLIGLGDADSIDRITVTWPSGRKQSFPDVPMGKLLVLFERSQDFTVTDYQRVTTDASLAEASAGAADHDTIRPLLQPVELTRDTTVNLPESGSPTSDSKIVVLTTMASWCTSCARHQPLVQKMAQEFDPSEVAFIGFAGDPEDPSDDLKGFVERLKIQYPVVVSPDAGFRTSVEAVLDSGDGSDILPSTIVLNNRGEVLETHSGIPSVSDLRRHLQHTRNE